MYIYIYIYNHLAIYIIRNSLQDIEEFITTVKNISITFGGINLEDIRASECFEIEQRQKKECNIPVFHDDQHGTAIAVGAGVLNVQDITNKNIKDIKIVCMGAGAAGISVLRFQVLAGATKTNIYLVDSKGVVYDTRPGLKANDVKREFAQKDTTLTLEKVMVDADIFIGLSGPNLLPPEYIKLMARDPVIFACSNPDPEVPVDDALAMRDDIIVSTGRSDYPNQVNNILGFPYIFRAALDIRASDINDEMKLAAAKAIASLARMPMSDEVIKTYGFDKPLTFGREYFIPKPTDSRLLGLVTDAVAKAAIKSGVARLPYPSNYPLKTLNDIF